MIMKAVMTIDPDSSELKYVQLARMLREQIISGAIPLGGKLPTEKQLTEQHRINRATVQEAVALLRREGLIVTKQGTGSYVAAVPEIREIVLRPGDTVRARMPGERERAELGIGPGIPVLVIARAGGGTEVYSGTAAACRCEDQDASLISALP